jgi:glycosyltransferase involved in cell wall biosynthesis
LHGAEKYIVVLGTIEPRKNVSQVLSFLKRNREFLLRRRVVFLGRFGWGSSVEELLANYNLTDMLANGRILFPGFVSEAAKGALLRNAELLVYPSMFEGFGLPVAEAACLSVPSLITRSSSLREVGGPCAYYFDPFIPEDFDNALNRALLDLELRNASIQKDLRNWIEQFSWRKTYLTLKSAVERLLDQEQLHARLDS